jgi:hypothetical protein
MSPEPVSTRALPAKVSQVMSPEPDFSRPSLTCPSSSMSALPVLIATSLPVGRSTSTNSSRSRLNQPPPSWGAMIRSSLPEKVTSTSSAFWPSTSTSVVPVSRAWTRTRPLPISR